LEQRFGRIHRIGQTEACHLWNLVAKDTREGEVYLRLLEKLSLPGKPLAGFVCPGYPLLDATLDLIIERHRDLLKRGAILVDDADETDRPRALLLLEHAIQDARTDRAGNRRVVSKRMQLKDQELAGRINAKLNSGLARQRADELAGRLQKRLTELEQERKLSPHQERDPHRAEQARRLLSRRVPG